MNDGELSPLAQEAVGLHEMFTSLCEGGFEEDQALRLVAYVMVANGRDQPKEDGA